MKIVRFINFRIFDVFLTKYFIKLIVDANLVFGSSLSLTPFLFLYFLYFRWLYNSIKWNVGLDIHINNKNRSLDYSIYIFFILFSFIFLQLLIRD